MNESELKKAVQSFWNARPCGSKFADQQFGSPEFFQAIERHRYTLEPHTAEMAAFEQARGKRVLEIGCGLGTDGARFAQAGADYIGLDLSPVSLHWARENVQQRHLPARWLLADAESLPFPDATFDLVYSSGVLHHTPDFAAAVAEIHRVLRPGGRAVVMTYHRHSLNYYVGIQFLRRLGAMLLTTNAGIRVAARLSGGSIDHLREHSNRLRQLRWSYLSGQTWLNSNTDGVGNPLSRVFTRREMQRYFGRFARLQTQVRFLHAESIPVLRNLSGGLASALAHRWGWHLYVLAEK
jgi:ubiquinone/menaquinone biosynthesis C-methylase UbiE